MKRRTFLGATGLLAVGGTTAGLVKNRGNVDATISDGKHLIGGWAKMTYKNGTTEFGTLSDEFSKISWAENGDLIVHFVDNHDMTKWKLLGPRPERKVIHSGDPPRHQGKRRVSLNHPLSSGSYQLVGKKLGLNTDEVTSRVSFPIRPTVKVLRAEPDISPDQARLEVKNTGTAPVKLSGVKITETPSGGSKQRLFERGVVLVLPGETRKVTSREKVFVSSKENSCLEYPDEINVSLYDSGEQIAAAKTRVTNVTDTNDC